MSKHTPTPWMATGNVTPWHTQRSQLIIQSKSINAANIAQLIPCAGMTADEVEANAQRIVACVNACAGIEHPQAHLSNLAYQKEKARQERDHAESKYMELRAKVLQVLDLQQKYFKTRDRDVLVQSKQAEKELRSLAEGGFL